MNPSTIPAVGLGVLRDAQSWGHRVCPQLSDTARAEGPGSALQTAAPADPSLHPWGRRIHMGPKTRGPRQLPPFHLGTLTQPQRGQGTARTWAGTLCQDLFLRPRPQLRGPRDSVVARDATLGWDVTCLPRLHHSAQATKGPHSQPLPVPTKARASRGSQALLLLPWARTFLRVPSAPGPVTTVLYVTPRTGPWVGASWEGWHPSPGPWGPVLLGIAGGSRAGGARWLPEGVPR